MAKKEKQAAPESDDAGKEGAPEGAEGAPKKGFLGKILSKDFLLSKKTLMIGAPVLLLLLGGAGGGTYYFMFMHKSEDEAKLAAAAEPVPVTPPNVSFYDVPTLLVSIQSTDGTPHYLKVTVTLELNDDLAKTGIKVLEPRLEDQFQSYLRELRMDDLNGSAGMARIKEELLRRVNVAAAPYKVRDVLLKEFIPQ